MGKDKIMDEQKVKRINELYRKSKAEGLTDAEKKEQKILRQILVSAWRAGKRTAVPKVTGKREMKFYYIESLNDLETGAFGILEPKEEKKGADCCLEKSDLLMLVPGVSFDPAGRRIGYGGGFYDTYLQKMEGCHTFGLAFEVQMADQIPAEAHDIRMEYVMTEKRCWKC